MTCKYVVLSRPHSQQKVEQGLFGTNLDSIADSLAVNRETAMLFMQIFHQAACSQFLVIAAN